MAYVNNIVAGDPIYQGAVRTLSFTVYTDGTPDEQVAAGTGTIQEITGYTLRWRLRDRNAPQTDRVSKTTGAGIAITGVFNASPALNTQRAVVTLAAADTASVSPDTYDHGLWRTDAGGETPLCIGTAVVKATP